MNKQAGGVTLVELLVAIVLLGLLAVGISSLDTFTRFHLMTSDRRAQLQNELSIVLEDISKNVVRATGDIKNQGIKLITNGFSVRVDNNATPSPSNYGDDATINYTLPTGGYKIQREEVGVSTIFLNRRDIIPSSGEFNYTILDNGVGIYVSLTARYEPTSGQDEKNPQLTSKTQVYSRSASSN